MVPEDFLDPWERDHNLMIDGVGTGLFECVQFINGNYLKLLLFDVTGMVNFVVDSPFGKN